MTQWPLMSMMECTRCKNFRDCDVISFAELAEGEVCEYCQTEFDESMIYPQQADNALVVFVSDCRYSPVIRFDFRAHKLPGVFRVIRNLIGEDCTNPFRAAAELVQYDTFLTDIEETPLELYNLGNSLKLAMVRFLSDQNDADAVRIIKEHSPGGLGVILVSLPTFRVYAFE